MESQRFGGPRGEDADGEDSGVSEYDVVTEWAGGWGSEDGWGGWLD